jgi:S-DNA-T family DNA segregation ATPase FtsK/SpoIIIE
VAQAKYKKKKESKGEISVHLKRGIKEGVVFLLGGIAIYLFISLLTYYPRDPGWSRSVESWQVQNYGGVFGAWFADIFLYLFGYMAYLLPVFFAMGGWLVYRSHEKTLTIDRKHLIFKTIGLLLSLVGGTGLAAMHFPGALGALPAQSGGILGSAVANALIISFSFVGATIFLLILFLAGIPLVVNFSWFWLMDEVGRIVLNVYDYLRDRIYQLKENRQSRQVRVQREKTVAQKQQVVQKKKPPRIAPVIKEVKVSERAQKEKQATLFDEDNPEAMPPLALLNEVQNSGKGLSKEALEALARLVELKLSDFGITVEVEAIHPGPVITRFEVQPAAGVKSSQISNLSKDLARAMSVASVRVVEVIPGKTTIGLEVPNENREIISLSDVLRSSQYESSSSNLTLALGKDISGLPVVADLAKMPHLLVAGTTGSGKSVAINAMILSLLYKASPNDVRLIMIDPKMLELSVYEGIPHLLAPVVTDMKEAANALRWCVAEMERRYQLMAALGVRNITGANRKIKEAIDAGTPIMDPLHNPESLEPAEPLETMPYIVVIIDELADMMMVVGKKVEELIARLAQKARAAGIHLVLATQRPSVDVITGLIKANIPTRIAFQVSSKIDSRTILDQMGAETLLGHGDMLYLPPGTAIPNRVHGAFVDDDEVHGVVAHLKKFGEADYIEDILTGPTEGGAVLPGEVAESSSEADPLYDQAVAIVTESRRASISGVQRRLKIGYNRAARLIEEMEAQGIVSPMQSNGNREVLAPPPPK